ncbi:GIY-YIG nuclease superfamily [uncultured Caudovirales phage]|uniref:GIY-YIG nuclease superfamily n=1 Tax=uncultured Caudovirales phage TaxID=2100421 RepID=A0A6J5N2F7_9CAUD|nr:GIY-YIG nuclease superfamily [uncultured Caudovirales phage]
MAGIYKIENIKTGYYYIGLSVDIFSRWSSHYTGIKTNKHSSTAFMQHWKDTEPSQWTFSILEYVSMTDYKIAHQIKGKALKDSFRKHLMVKEKEHMSKYSINYALNKDNKHFS